MRGRKTACHKRLIFTVKFLQTIPVLSTSHELSPLTFSHLQDAFYDYAPAEKKVAFQEVTIIRKTLGLESSPPLDHYALQMQICVLKMPKEHDQHFISFHLPAAAVALGYIYSDLGGGTLSQSMPLSNRECQSTELKPERPAPVHRESFRLCLNSLFISLQQKHHLNSLTDLFLL